jgi:hypothetical protein
LKKPSQTGLNRFFPKMTEPNRNRSVWTGFSFFSKNQFWLLFFYKNQTESKIITSKPTSPSLLDLNYIVIF